MMKRIIFFVICVILTFCSVSTAVFADSIPKDAKEYNGNYYMAYESEGMTWREAKALCEENGGHLAVITDDGENEFVYSLVSQVGVNCWLGATDKDEEGVWKWVTDEEWAYNNAVLDNTGGLQHYLVMIHKNGNWDDQSERDSEMSNYYCSAAGYVCEWEGEKEELPSEEVSSEAKKDESDSTEKSSGLAELWDSYFIVITVVISVIVVAIGVLITFLIQRNR